MKLYPTRRDLLFLVPQNGTIVELGVFAGDFSEQIREVCQPKMLHLVDQWEGWLYSGDKDGLNGQTFHGDELFDNVSKRFDSFSNVMLHRMPSMNALECFPDSSLDAVYIDDDHSEQAVYERMTVAMRKLKRGGWIMGHDFMCNPAKTDRFYPFTVATGVYRFLEEHKLKLAAMALDGWVSFAVQLPRR